MVELCHEMMTISRIVPRHSTITLLYFFRTTTFWNSKYFRFRHSLKYTYYAAPSCYKRWYFISYNIHGDLMVFLRTFRFARIFGMHYSTRFTNIYYIKFWVKQENNIIFLLYILYTAKSPSIASMLSYKSYPKLAFPISNNDWLRSKSNLRTVTFKGFFLSRKKKNVQHPCFVFDFVFFCYAYFQHQNSNTF